MNPLRAEIAPGVFTLASTDHELRVLLRQRDRATAEITSIDAAMLPLRRAYADARGERMLPTVERLRRELLNG